MLFINLSWKQAGLFWGLIFVLGHLLYIDTPFVNQEYVFAEAAKSLLSPQYRIGLENYWNVQANPLGYSAISALVNGIFHFPVGFWSVRIPSLAGGLMVILAGGWIAKKFNFNRSRFFLWAALIIFSPLIWVYAGRATADVLPTGLLMLSLALCLKADENKIYNFIASVVFSISILVKYNSILYSLCISNKDTICIPLHFIFN